MSNLFRKLRLEEASTNDVLISWLKHADFGSAIQCKGLKSWVAHFPKTASYIEAETPGALAEKLKQIPTKR